MQIIIRGNRDYQKFLASEKNNEDTIIRPSFFALRQETKDGMLLCNTLTGELVLLSDEEKEQYDQLPSKASLTDLIQHRFVVADDCQEDQAADQLRALMMKRRGAKKNINHYNILPTTFCNAHCFYCYESRIRHVYMSEETARNLVGFIAEHHGNEKVKLAWFGGEPMVGLNRIDQVCGGLEARNIAFESEMTSNGYLFDADLVKHAKEAWKLKSIQITLDGPEDVYNRIKAYTGVSDNPYQRVLQNIGYFADAGIHVDIRLNLDTHNAENLVALIQELADHFPDKKHLHVYVAILDEGAGFEPIQHQQGDLDALQQRLIDLQELLENKGWPQYKDKKLPSLRIACCMADNPSAVQCTPDGIFSKCEDQIYNQTVGSLETGIVDWDTIRWWQERRMFEGCAECPLYPSCNRLLKHCPVSAKCTDYDKSRRIARYKEIMLKEYEKWKSNAT